MDAADIEQIRKSTQELEDKLFKQPGDNPPVPPAVTPPVPPEPPAVTPPEPPPVTPPPDQPPEPPPVDQPPVEPPPVPPTDQPPAQPTPPPEPPPVPPTEDFKHKYDVLQGKYNKEVKEANKRSKEASDRVIALEYERGQLQRQVTDLTSRLERLEQGPASTPPSTPGYDIDKDPEAEYIKREFPDLWKSFSNVLKKVQSSTVSEATGQIEQVKKEVRAVAEQGQATAKVGFEKYLDDNVDGWRTVDVDPAFAAWLQSPAPYTNIPKRYFIDKAIREKDAVTASKFFVDFALENSSETPPKPTPTPTPNPTPAPNPSKPAVTVPPRSPLPSPTPQRHNTEIVTTDYIGEFYDNLRRGKYDHKRDWAKAEEIRISQAVAEGRVK